MNDDIPLELVSGGDTLLHYHNQDRGPFPIPLGSFYDTTTQTAASTTTAYVMTCNTTSLSYGVALASGSRITVQGRGVYNLQFSCQLENTDVADQDVDVWFRKNGVDVTESNTIVNVPAKHGGVNGHTVAAWNYFVPLTPKDYVEIVWHTSSVTVSLPHYVAAASPTRPSTPSVIITMNLVSV